MAASRQEKIEAMLAADPADQTLRYMLAMELQTVGEHTRSLDLLHRLMEDETPYVPAFLMAGQQLTKLSRLEEARTVYTRGIEQAELQDNAHAAGEMAQFRTELPAL